MRHRASPIASYFLSMVCMALFATSLMSACNKNQRADTIHASIVAVDAASAGFLAWDRKHQQTIVAQATSREEAETKLASYQATTQNDVKNGIALGYRELALAGSQNDDPSLTAALRGVADLVASIKQLIGGP